MPDSMTLQEVFPSMTCEVQSPMETVDWVNCMEIKRLYRKLIIVDLKWILIDQMTVIFSIESEAAMDSPEIEMI